MIIYIDLVVISTIIVNVLIVEGIESIFREKIRIIRLIISSLLSVLLLILYLVPIGKITWIRYLLGIPIAVIAFPKGGILKLMMQVVLYYLLHLALIGTLAVFKIRNIFFLVTATLLVIVLAMIISMRTSHNLEVKIGKKIYKALYDSGNASYYMNIPVIYMDSKYYSNDYNPIGQIVVNHLNGSSVITIYEGPKLKINHQQIITYYAFSSLSGYDLILHKDFGGKRCLNY